MIDAPGVYDIPESEYHSDPVVGGSLSCSEARRLLDSPAKYRYQRDSGLEKTTDDFDFGHVVHGLVLGTGRPVHVVMADDWRTKIAQIEKIKARAAGEVPVLFHTYETAVAMAAAVNDHPVAAHLFEAGQAEQTLLWEDERTGIRRRARVDWMADLAGPRRRRIFVDYKTTKDASGRAFGRSAADYGYHQQADWYCEGGRILLGVDVAMVFVAQEKEPPFLVNVIELDEEALRVGRERNAAALQIFLACTQTGRWPGFGPEIERVALPRWAVMQHAEDFGEPEQ